MPRGFAIVKTKALLVDFASEHDGQCKVALTVHGPMAIPPDKEIGSTYKTWDYYFSDEPECFPFDKYGITQ